jgi:hypothetical protein
MFRFKRPLSLYLAACIALAGLTHSAQAAFVGAEQIAATTATPRGAADRALVAATLDRPEVQAQLERLGVDPVQARERVAALSDDEAAYLAQHAETAPAGGIIGAILLVFFVLLLTDILGLTKIFPFTRPVR